MATLQPTALDPIYEGDDVTIPLKLSPVPSAGIGSNHYLFSLKRSYNDSAALIQKTVGSGITILDATNAALKVVLAAADTARATGIGPGFYVWSLEQTDSGSVKVVKSGTLTVRPKAS